MWLQPVGDLVTRISFNPGFILCRELVSPNVPKRGDQFCQPPPFAPCLLNTDLSCNRPLFGLWMFLGAPFPRRGTTHNCGLPVRFACRPSPRNWGADWPKAAFCPNGLERRPSTRRRFWVGPKHGKVQNLHELQTKGCNTRVPGVKNWGHYLR